MQIRFSLILLSGFLSFSAHACASMASDKASVLGADVNGNGVRDDVEVYIQKNFSKEDQSRAAMQLARALQALLTLDSNDREKSKTVSEQGTRAINCMYFSFPGPPTSFHPAHASELIMEKTFNTRGRKIANQKFSKAVDGTTSEIPNRNTCE